MAVDMVLSSREAVSADSSSLGGKAANLAALQGAGLPVPQWVVLTTEAFDQQLAAWQLHGPLEEQLAAIRRHADDAAYIRDACDVITNAFAGCRLSACLGSRLADACHEAGLTGPSQYLAVRSSVVGEDALNDSFAGQMDSFLQLQGAEEVAADVIRCWASAFSERAIRYRLLKGLPLTDIRAGVIVQRMIGGTVSGVLFTAHPVTGSRQQALLTATYGLGEGLVSGRCNADEFTVSHPLIAITEKTIATKDLAIAPNPSGAGTLALPVPAEKAGQPCLTDDQVVQIVSEGTRLAAVLKAPQDIEWTVSEGKVWYLQTRPITRLPQPPAGSRIVWNNANIQESYLGVTTPLTFSFARMAYARVYTDTMRIMGIPQKVIDAHGDMLHHLLGLLRGRVYYNINNWYRGLLLLPSFKTNKGDMEAMMGLQEPVDFIRDRELSWAEKARKLPRLLVTLLRLLRKFRNMDRHVARFHEQFEQAYRRIDRAALHTLEIPSLLGLVRQLEQDMLGRWQTPIINDFFVMMYNGRLKRLLQHSGVQNPAALQNNLLSGEPDMASTEPTRALMALAAQVRRDAALQQLFADTPDHRLLPVLRQEAPSFHAACQNYIERYGDRCMGELKLESVSLRQDPAFMFAVIRNYAAREELTPEGLQQREHGLRGEAEATAFAAIRKKHLLLGVRRFQKTLLCFRRGVRYREAMRLARTRMFGLFRDLYLEIGRQLAVQGLLGEAADVFYLTVEELKDLESGTSVNADLQGITAARKAEFAGYKSEAPPHHLETRGMVYPVSLTAPEAPGLAVGHALKGIGCYPGVVQSTVQLIFSPKDELTVNGRILCTVRTDPGWAPLFPTCSGLIVERGSTLSHSAVVARELGIPAIVGVPGITQILKTGDEVRMDGATGDIYLIPQIQP